MRLTDHYFQDIAILTNNATVERCEYYKNNSENVLGRFYCKYPEKYFIDKEAANRGIKDIPITQAECEVSLCVIILFSVIFVESRVRFESNFELLIYYLRRWSSTKQLICWLINIEPLLPEYELRNRWSRPSLSYAGVGASWPVRNSSTWVCRGRLVKR